ncbi:MAG: SDR family NAD(P)-dependent oxidoreductase [Actinomycetes bacterium]
MGRLDGRVAIVTGAGRGIGRATALRLAADGASVVVNDLDADVAEQVAQEITTTGRRALAFAGNGARAEEARALVTSCVEELGALDILVNNAGTTRDKMFHTMTEDALDAVLDANLRTTFCVTQAAMPHLREVAKREIAEHGEPRHHRKIVNTASVVAFTGNPGQWNYTAAKGAIVSATKTLARELGPFRINVNAVAPGFVETRLTQPKETASAEGEGVVYGIPEQQRQASLAMIALGRLGRPEDVANVTAFLVSPDADFVSGVTVPVTGGQFGGMG